MRIETLDLDYRGTRHAIASFLVFGEAAPVLVETGPTSTLSALQSGLADHGVEVGDIRHVLLTHIHLDHAGAAGWWGQRGAQIYVHPRGAPHLIDPAKLLASAARIYGDQMDALWGDVLPVPAARVTAVEDGDVIEVEGLRFTALETPGHARHHHVYRLGDIAFTGDAAGIRIPGSDWIDLPAPPPEFDLEAWMQTLARLRKEELQTIYRTHFGPAITVDGELSALEALLEGTVAKIRELTREGLERREVLSRYSQWVAERARASGTDGEVIAVYEIANPRDMSVDGVLRYLRAKGG